ncbi:hypothetical protein BC939DRAFT_450717 [Gamsiella multidivaricata]|uniref:uncharacterized protein n=1 Tax=Gamsiella multidivaricata TaxID=101098 RepID=UPI0022204F09|nr:uncharacterized protein BC939DRAFT_450717 [Gamsiella multidivaricata]KAI7824141.1 hypothetical protein BC939DRAFT_450717 [Gamsiella multidivaricata]
MAPRIGGDRYHHRNIQFSSATASTRIDTLPVEILFCIIDSLPPRSILMLAQVSSCLRTISLSQLLHAYDIQIINLPQSSSSTRRQHSAPNLDTGIDLTYEDEDMFIKERSRMGIKKVQERWMSSFELYVRMVLSDLYFQERCPSTGMDASKMVTLTLSCSQQILRRLYLSDQRNHQNQPNNNDDNDNDSNHRPTSSISPTHHLNPFVSSIENLHIIARVIADQVCRGICLPETAVLILQCLTSLHDQDHFQYMIHNPVMDEDSTMLPPHRDNCISVGVLSFQYLVPTILSLLQPPTTKNLFSSTASERSVRQRGSAHIDLHSRIQWTPSPPPLSLTSSITTRSLTSDILPTQQSLLSPLHIRSLQHLTQILCFLPLLGRHFNTLPTSIFIDTFLNRSRGDLPIDRAAVLVYGYMCVLDPETGKANLASESYRIFERSMPTRGVVQAEEIVRVVERYRRLVRASLFEGGTAESANYPLQESG